MTDKFNAQKEVKQAVAAFTKLIDADGKPWQFELNDARPDFQHFKFTDPESGDRIGVVTVFTGRKNAKPDEWRRELAVFFRVAGPHVTGGRKNRWGQSDPNRETSRIDVAFRHVQNYFRVDNQEELHRKAMQEETAPAKRAIQVANEKLHRLADRNAAALARLAVFGESGVIAQVVEEEWTVLGYVEEDSHYPDMVPGGVSTFRQQYMAVTEALEDAERNLSEVEEDVNERFGVV